MHSFIRFKKLNLVITLIILLNYNLISILIFTSLLLYYFKVEYKIGSLK